MFAAVRGGANLPWQWFLSTIQTSATRIERSGWLDLFSVKLIKLSSFYKCDSNPVVVCHSVITDQASALGMSMEDEFYRENVGEGFYSDSVKIWRFKYMNAVRWSEMKWNEMKWGWLCRSLWSDHCWPRVHVDKKGTSWQLMHVAQNKREMIN